MMADSDFGQTLEKSMIKQSLILFPYPESQTAYIKLAMPSLSARMKNAPATFQRMVNKLVQDIDGCEGYIDDVVIYSDNWSDHIRQIKCFFQIMREAKLTINLMKSEFGKATVNLP